MDYVEIIVSILTGLAACIPLVIKLVEYVQKAIKEKNWQNLLTLVMGWMQEAEGKFKEGSEKKEWVMMMVKASAESINYNIDMIEVGKLIDALCDMSNAVNPPNRKEESNKQEEEVK
jgi:hypothetical protein